LGHHAALNRDLRAEMRSRDNGGNAAGDMLERSAHQHVALGIGQHELLGKIRQKTQTVGAGVDHEIDTAFLAAQIEFAVGLEGGRHDRKHAAITAMY
jgi:hypothetical protein